MRRNDETTQEINNEKRMGGTISRKAVRGMRGMEGEEEGRNCVGEQLGKGKGRRRIWKGDRNM